MLAYRSVASGPIGPDFPEGRYDHKEMISPFKVIYRDHRAQGSHGLLIAFSQIVYPWVPHAVNVKNECSLK